MPRRQSIGLKASADLKPGRNTQLTELAREATEAFVDAQKKVLDVFAQQGEVNLQTARSMFEVLNPFQPAIMKEFSRNTVENFVNTEKALLDLFYKPVRASAHERERPSRKPPQRKRAAAQRKRATATA